MSGIRNAPPISISSPRETTTSRPWARDSSAEQDRGRVVVDHERCLGPGEPAEQGVHVGVAGAARLGRDVELEVRVACGDEGEPGERRPAERRPPEVRVQHDAGRVDHPVELPGAGRGHCGAHPRQERGRAERERVQLVRRRGGQHRPAALGEHGADRLHHAAPGRLRPAVERPDHLVDRRQQPEPGLAAGRERGGRPGARCRARRGPRSRAGHLRASATSARCRAGSLPSAPSRRKGSPAGAWPAWCPGCRCPCASACSPGPPSAWSRRPPRRS